MRSAREHGDAALLERLTQHLEHAAIEFRHLVEEQHAVVRQADLARPRRAAAADQRDVGDGVMRRAERPRRSAGRRRPAAARRPSGWWWPRALRRTTGRQDARQPPREHRLAGAGRPDHQQVVTAGRRDLERAPGERLAANVGEVGRAAGRRCRRLRAGRAAAASGHLRRGGSARDRLGQRRDGHSRRPSTTPASATFSWGSSSRGEPMRRASAAIGSTPRAGESIRRATARRRRPCRRGRAGERAGGREQAEGDRQVEGDRPCARRRARG